MNLRRAIITGIMLVAAFLNVSFDCYASKKFIDTLPRFSKCEPNFSITKIREYLSSLPLHHIEGIWQFTNSGFTVAIVREHTSPHSINATPEGYNIVLIQAPNRALRPGTIIGAISRSATEGVYDARIYTKSSGSIMTSPKGFSIKISNDDSRITFEQKKGALSVNFWRLLPYAWRYTVRTNQTPSYNDGCIRIFPEPELPLEPIYL